MDILNASEIVVYSWMCFLMNLLNFFRTGFFAEHLTAAVIETLLQTLKIFYFVNLFTNDLAFNFTMRTPQSHVVLTILQNS